MYVCFARVCVPEVVIGQSGGYVLLYSPVVRSRPNHIYRGGRGMLSFVFLVLRVIVVNFAVRGLIISFRMLYGGARVCVGGGRALLRTPPPGTVCEVILMLPPGEARLARATSRWAVTSRGSWKGVR